MILAFLLACAHDPPVRPMDELPYIAERGMAFATEEQAFYAVRRTMEMAGFVGLGSAQLVFSEPALVPTTSGNTITLRRSLTGPAQARQHLAEVGQALLGRPFALEGWNDADLWEAYQAFFVAALGHELSHVAASSARAHDNGDYYVEERRARATEWPLLHRLAEQNRIPDRWLELYPRFLDTLMSEIPLEIVAQIPEDPGQAAALFHRGYLVASTAPDPNDVEMQVAVAMALGISRWYTQAPPVPLEQLVEDYAPHPADTELLVAGGLRLLQDEGYTVQAAGDELVRDGAPYTFIVQIDEGSDLARVWARAPLSVEPARQGELIQAMNLANREGEVVLAWEDPGLSLRGDWFKLTAEYELAIAVRTAAIRADAWFPPLEQVAKGELTPVAAAQAAHATLTPPEPAP